MNKNESWEGWGDGGGGDIPPWGFRYEQLDQFPQKKRGKNRNLQLGSTFLDRLYTEIFRIQYTDKKENKIFFMYKEIQRDRVQSHI